MQDGLGRMGAQSEELMCFAVLHTGTAHLAARASITPPERACTAKEVLCAPVNAPQLIRDALP